MEKEREVRQYLEDVSSPDSVSANHVTAGGSRPSASKNGKPMAVPTKKDVEIQTFNRFAPFLRHEAWKKARRERLWEARREQKVLEGGAGLLGKRHREGAQSLSDDASRLPPVQDATFHETRKKDKRRNVLKCSCCGLGVHAPTLCTECKQPCHVNCADKCGRCSSCKGARETGKKQAVDTGKREAPALWATCVLCQKKGKKASLMPCKKCGRPSHLKCMQDDCCKQCRCEWVYFAACGGKVQKEESVASLFFTNPVHS